MILILTRVGVVPPTGHWRQEQCSSKHKNILQKVVFAKLQETIFKVGKEFFREISYHRTFQFYFIEKIFFGKSIDLTIEANRITSQNGTFFRIWSTGAGVKITTYPDQRWSYHQFFSIAYKFAKDLGDVMCSEYKLNCMNLIIDICLTSYIEYS